MPESIFQQVSLDILRLHQHTARSLLAVPHDEAAEIHDTVFAMIEGRYYMLVPQSAALCDKRTGILLIETDDAQARISWVASARTIQHKSNIYRRALAALQRRVQQTKQSLNSENQRRFQKLCWFVRNNQPNILKEQKFFWPIH